jgi:tRNA modification GTPase
MDTIFALATVRGRSGVAVIRISGDKAFVAAEALMHRLPPVGKPGLRRLLDENGELIDEALVHRFAGPRSFTGEDVVELHLHGSPAVIAAIEQLLSRTGLARYAEPGEFTRRALQNEKLDLAQVEGLGDLLQAETEAQRRQAMRLLQGRLGSCAEMWRGKLLRSAALVEATIDFADEEVPVEVLPEVSHLLTEVQKSLRQEIEGSKVAERVRDGFVVAILGAPNAGKSTLLNHIAGRDVAITSDIAGTTRDILEVRLDLKGVPVTLLDTAGLRESADEIEKIGVERTKARAREADVRILLLSVADSAPPDVMQAGDIVVRGKADLCNGPGVSGVTGKGVDELLEAVHGKLSDRMARIGTATHERHRASMEEASGAIDQALRYLEEMPEAPEIAAEQMRVAMRALDSLTGRIDVEAILGEIFSSFCIGK